MRIRRRDKIPTPSPTETLPDPVTEPGPSSLDPVKSLITDAGDTANGTAPTTATAPATAPARCPRQTPPAQPPAAPPPVGEETPAVRHRPGSPARARVQPRSRLRVGESRTRPRRWPKEPQSQPEEVHRAGEPEDVISPPTPIETAEPEAEMAKKQKAEKKAKTAGPPKGEEPTHATPLHSRRRRPSCSTGQNRPPASCHGSSPSPTRRAGSARPRPR